MALKEILIPITIAVFMTYLLYPVLEFLYKYKIPRWVTLTLLLLGMLGLYYLLGLLLASNYNLFANRIQYYASKLLAFIESVLAPLMQHQFSRDYLKQVLYRIFLIHFPLYLQIFLLQSFSGYL